MKGNKIHYLRADIDCTLCGLDPYRFGSTVLAVSNISVVNCKRCLKSLRGNGEDQ